MKKSKWCLPSSLIPKLAQASMSLLYKEYNSLGFNSLVHCQNAMIIVNRESYIPLVPLPKGWNLSAPLEFQEA